MFCSDTCKQEATSAYHSMEAALDLAPLIKHCKHYDERFPLLVARAACMHLTHSSHLTEQSPSTSRAIGTAKAGYPQGDVWQVQLWQSWAQNHGRSSHGSKHALRQAACLTILPVSCAHYRLHRLSGDSTMHNVQRWICKSSSCQHFSCSTLRRLVLQIQHWCTPNPQVCCRTTNF